MRLEKKEHSILFSGPMVKAILEGQKTQTRRVVKGSFEKFEEGWSLEGREPRALREDFCPYGQVGDRLWVRETFMNTRPTKQNPDDVIYRADYVGKALDRWSSPIHMPRWASRLTLEITDVRVDRVQAISNEEAYAEGIQYQRHDLGAYASPYGRFAEGWDKLNAKRGYSWDSNPWVWCISFQRT